MTADIIISKKNESYLNIDCDMGILQELKEHFSFFVDGYKHMPKYKARLWDGRVSLIDIRFGTIYAGLFDELVEQSKKFGYTVDVIETQYGLPGDKDEVTIEEILEFVKSLNVYSHGKPLEIRDYQIQALYNCIRDQRQFSITPTGGGKSFIAYCLYRWYLAKGCGTFLMTVTTLGLMKQILSDFLDYSSHNGFDIANTTQLIGDGASKKLEKQLVISTWQSIYKQPSTWFNQCDVILGDEAHTYKGEAVRAIFERGTDVKYRFGLTGSLGNSTVNTMVLKGLIGNISKEKTTRDLINEGHLCDIKIKCVLLKYNKESKKLLKSADYQTEIDFLCQHEKRNNFISKLALSQKGVTLVLFNYVDKHGMKLYEKIKSKAEGQQVHLVCGKVDADVREEIRKLVSDTSSGEHIIVASSGTMSTGVNIPRIDNIIFASPTKAVIRIIQSIGRGLRKSKDKDFLNLFDLADIINGSKTRPNFTYRHFVERLRIYVDEGHEYKLLEIDLERD